MRILTLFITILLCGCQTALKKEEHVVADCSIYTRSGKLIRKYPGKQCRFLPDGSWISRDADGLVKYGRDFKEQWRTPGHFHHLVTPASSGDWLASTSRVYKFRGQQTRFDVLNRVGPDGKMKSEFDFYKNLNKLAVPDLTLYKFEWDRAALPDARMESSHVNSIYEIPPNASSAKIPAFSPGNVIVNAMGMNYIYILDRDLKEILWRHRYVHPYGRSLALTHDVQVLANGNLFIYVNHVVDGGKNYSELVEWSPLLDKAVWSYAATPKESFFSPINGGMQLLENGNVLFSDVTDGGKVIEISREGRIVSSFATPTKIQDAKVYDLSEFLKNNPGP